MTEIPMSGIPIMTTHIGSPIFWETFAKIRMEKFEKLKKKPMFKETRFDVENIHDILHVTFPIFMSFYHNFGHDRLRNTIF